MPRTSAGGMTGAQCLVGPIELYQAAGAIRLQLIGLIAAERARQAVGTAHD